MSFGRPTPRRLTLSTVGGVNPWRRASSGLDQRQLPLVLILVALLVIDGQLRGEGELTVAAIPAVGIATLPSLWRTSAPRTALLLTVVGVFLCLATLKPYDVVALPVVICAYSVSVAFDRLRSVLLAAFVLPAAVVGVVWSPGSAHGGSLIDALFNCSILLLAVVTGDAVRARRAYKQAAIERDDEQAREQHAEAQRMVAEERLRIAQEVHDVVAHAMVAINVQAGVAAHVLDRRPEQVRSALQDIKATSGAALADLRGTLGLLRDQDTAAPVRPTGTLAGVSELAGPLRAAGIRVDVRFAGEQDRVPSAVGQAVYRIVQEASTNIMRHTAARRASINIDVGPDAVDVVVDDDGAARHTAGIVMAAGSGNGLSGMSERAAALGGSLDAGRQVDGRWQVRAILPL